MEEYLAIHILKRGDTMPDDIKIAEEASIYDGADCPIVMRREYFIEFNCDYNLLMYPFDTQICRMLVQVNGIPKQYLHLGAQLPKGCGHCEGADYLGSRTMWSI